MSIDVVDLQTRDEQIFEEALIGTSKRVIARQFKTTEEEVSAAIKRLLPTISDQMRKDYFEFDLARLDAIQRPVMQRILRENDVMAIPIYLKIAELRADYLGNRAATKIDAKQLVALCEPEETTTEQIQRVIDNIRRNIGPPPGEASGNGHDKPESDAALKPEEKADAD